jgi:hypothetical protein
MEMNTSAAKMTVEISDSLSRMSKPLPRTNAITQNHGSTLTGMPKRLNLNTPGT